ncbi:hypothetical protein H2200_003882 [Cladophialophora chaetospira]|uniref:CRIB domain-containing protein n=1 Tax=Cladophialophora chaetospira TaxID=386627 RepID=A0AA38XF20_9EURO|nr:hypothetical protein H2200_003882 [Cladophialophora chaetospira]
MGRFPWSQGHSKHGGDKLYSVAQEWFSKEQADPSRQSVNDLMTDSSMSESIKSDLSPKVGGRSRTDTVTSSFSSYAHSMSDTSNDLASRPPSQQSFTNDGMPLSERHESTAKSLLAKGTRLLKRQGSKLNLLSLQQTEDRPNHPVEAGAGELSPGKGLQRQATLISRRLKPSISGPFAFQHLTHGEQGRFQSLDSVSKTDLTSEFIAVQSDQEPTGQFRGLSVTDLPMKADDPRMEHGFDEPTSPTTDAIPYLPTTPPRPRPPPKDGLMSPYSPTDFRMSRSMENFSRPTRLSVTALDVSPTSASTHRLSTLSPISLATASAKPLPHLPGAQVVHAVSTGDDIALPLRTAPLPSPPKAIMEVVEEETLEEKDFAPLPHSRSQPSMMHMLPQPTSKLQRRRSQSSGEINFDATSFKDLSGRSSLRAAQIEKSGETSPKSKNRISIGVRPIVIEDWEDAVDYSWDHAAELEADEDGADNSAVNLRQASNLSIPRDNYLVVEQSFVDEASSSASTPLMMQAHSKSSREEPAYSTCRAEDPSSPLLGLGIDSLQPLPNISLSTAASAQHEVRNNLSSHEFYQSQAMPSPASIMSKSSSQESIIASIFGTQRSSNSSNSLSDFAHLASGSFGGSMEHLKLDLQDFSAAPAPETHLREGSQDTIREDVQHTKSMEALAEVGVIAPFSSFTTSPTTRHDRGASASQIPNIPARKSSIADAGDASITQTGRKRAATGISRPRRNTRVSYSLFPTTATS